MDVRKLGELQSLMRRLIIRIDELEQVDEMRFDCQPDVEYEVGRLGIKKITPLGSNAKDARSEYPSAIIQVASDRLSAARNEVFGEAIKQLEGTIAELVVKVRNEVLNAAPIDSVVVSDVPADVSKRILAALETEVPQIVSVPRDSSEHPGDGYRWVEVGETIIVGDQWLIHGHYANASDAVVGTVNQASKQLRRKVCVSEPGIVGRSTPFPVVEVSEKPITEFRSLVGVAMDFGDGKFIPVESFKVTCDNQVIIDFKDKQVEVFSSDVEPNIHSSEPRKLYISRETIDETVNKLRAFAESCTTYDSAELIEFASQLVGMLPVNGITPE